MGFGLGKLSKDFFLIPGGENDLELPLPLLETATVRGPKGISALAATVFLGILRVLNYK
jgi:hypothetical protein